MLGAVGIRRRRSSDSRACPPPSRGTRRAGPRTGRPRPRRAGCAAPRRSIGHREAGGEIVGAVEDDVRRRRSGRAALSRVDPRAPRLDRHAGVEPRRPRGARPPPWAVPMSAPPNERLALEVGRARPGRRRSRSGGRCPPPPDTGSPASRFRPRRSAATVARPSAAPGQRRRLPSARCGGRSAPAPRRSRLSSPVIRQSKTIVARYQVSLAPGRGWRLARAKLDDEPGGILLDRRAVDRAGHGAWRTAPSAPTSVGDVDLRSHNGRRPGWGWAQRPAAISSATKRVSGAVICGGAICGSGGSADQSAGTAGASWPAGGGKAASSPSRAESSGSRAVSSSVSTSSSTARWTGAGTS